MEHVSFLMSLFLSLSQSSESTASSSSLPSHRHLIDEGTRKGLMECKVQFSRERWNCTQSDIQLSTLYFQNSVRSSSSLNRLAINTNNNIINSINNNSLISSASITSPASTLTSSSSSSSSSVPTVGLVSPERSDRETAFLYAISSAGVVHSVTQACSAGNLTDCSCDRSRLGHVTTSEGWKWGGCSDNVRYGMMFAKHVVDSRDRTARDSARSSQDMLRALMNLHNNQAGRLAVANQMDLKCRCHGISGSCELKTCWRTLPAFHQVGNFLRKKYDTAVQITERQTKRRLRKKGKVKRKVIVNVPKEDLVYINRSPNYCVEDKSKGILGTTGRICAKTTPDDPRPDSCSLLCCGRGYNTKIEKITTRCDCKFEWCCNVQCNVCESENDIYTCK